MSVITKYPTLCSLPMQHNHPENTLFPS